MIKTDTTQKVSSNEATARYIEGIGRRKKAIARVRITPLGNDKKTNLFIVNGKKVEEYFPIEDLQRIVRGGVTEAKPSQDFAVSVLTSGGGIHAQAEAVRHGFARALVVFDEELRKRLKKAGMLKRDPRRTERKKFGLKKARKAPQWSKR